MLDRVVEDKAEKFTSRTLTIGCTILDLKRYQESTSPPTPMFRTSSKPDKNVILERQLGDINYNQRTFGVGKTLPTCWASTSITSTRSFLLGPIKQNYTCPLFRPGVKT